MKSQTQTILRQILEGKKKQWPNLPTLFVIDDHVGGTRNPGWYEARYAVPSCHDYPEYIEELRTRLGQQGDIVTAYRSSPADDVDALNAGDPTMFFSTTTSVEALDRFHQMFRYSDPDRVKLRMQVSIEDVMFEGHDGEFELVIRNPYDVELLTSNTENHDQ